MGERMEQFSEEEVQMANKCIRAIKEMQIKWHWDCLSLQSGWLSSRKQTTYDADGNVN
jgi:hypothetical protein